MTSRSLLSKAQEQYYLSQTNEITNLSEQKDRIETSIEKSFNAFKIILDSNKVDQEFKDKLFPSKKVWNFIELLTRYNSDNTTSQESNKQETITKLLDNSLTYLQRRYKKTQLISKEIKNFRQLLDTIVELTQAEIKQTEDMAFYKTRMNPHVPYLPPRGNTWQALCIACLSYTTQGESEKDSIKKVRHTKNCLFNKQRKTDKTIYEQYFRIIPPEKKN